MSRTRTRQPIQITPTLYLDRFYDTEWRTWVGRYVDANRNQLGDAWYAHDYDAVLVLRPDHPHVVTSHEPVFVGQRDERTVYAHAHRCTGSTRTLEPTHCAACGASAVNGRDNLAADAVVSVQLRYPFGGGTMGFGLCPVCAYDLETQLTELRLQGR